MRVDIFIDKYVTKTELYLIIQLFIQPKKILPQ